MNASKAEALKSQQPLMMQLKLNVLLILQNLYYVKVGCVTTKDVKEFSSFPELFLIK
jgi:hypothetical protein